MPHSFKFVVPRSLILGLTLLLSAAMLTISQVATAQCGDDETTIAIVIVADNYPAETSWELLQNNEIIASGGSVGDTICIDGSTENACLQFSIFDSFGDGIFEPGVSGWRLVDLPRHIYLARTPRHADHSGAVCGYRF